MTEISWSIEIKRTTAPALTATMRSALADLRLNSLTVIRSGSEAPRPQSAACRAQTASASSCA